jgi:hypothetical protein
MTPKDKAIDLLQKYDFDGELCGQYFTMEMSKVCVLILVDSIILEINENKKYWEQVKQEIQKI